MHREAVTIADAVEHLVAAGLLVYESLIQGAELLVRHGEQLEKVNVLPAVGSKS